MEDPLFNDDIGPHTTGRHVSVPQDPAKTGEIVSAEIADICRDQVGFVRLNVRVQTEVVSRAYVSSVVGGSTFGTTWTGQIANNYADCRVYLTNSRHHCTAPGRFAVIAPGKAVVKLRGSSNIRIGRARNCLNVNGKSHVVISGFEWSGYTVSNAMRCTGGDAVDVTVTENLFRGAYGERSFGVNANSIDPGRITGLTLHRNRAMDIVQMGFCRHGGAQDLTITENVLHRLGSAALSTSGGSNNVIWARNIISEIRGIHTNGASLYQNATNHTVEDNFFFGVVRALTFQGQSGGPVVHNHIIRRNVFLTEINWAALWENGRTMDTVLIEGNVAVATRGAGIYITKDNLNFTIRNNLANSFNYANSSAGDNFSTWTIGADNVVIPQSWVAGATLTPDYCRADGPSGVFYELDLRDVAPVA
jgi:hypothetical protein